MRFAPRGKITLYGTQSSGNYTCNLMTNDKGYDLLSGEGTQVNSATFDQANQTLVMEVNIDYGWITCSTVASSVTVSALVCP
jgi:hypothetical protein